MKILVVYKNKYNQGEYRTFSKALDGLKSLGHNIKTDLEFRSGNDQKSVEQFQKNLEKSIRENDVILTDITDPDTKIGFDIAKAISEKKIIIALRKKSKSKTPILPIEGSKSKSFIVKDYTEKNLSEVATEAIEAAKSKLDTKFILIISPEIDRYLDWASKTKRMHKAQIVRNSLELSIKKDKDYKNFTKN